MELSGVPDEVEIVTRRVSFLSELGDGPCHKSELADALGYSRSTVDRAIKALNDAGYVERTEEGYVRTQAGRLAAERYQTFLDDQQRLLDAREILAPVPSDCELPTAILSDASVEVIDGLDQLLDRVTDRLDGTDRHRGLFPESADPRHIQHLRVEADDDADLELVVPQTLLDTIPETAVDDESITTTSMPTNGYALLLWTRTDETDTEATTVSVLTYEDEKPVGVLTTDDDRAVQWATDLFEARRDAATDGRNDTQVST